MKRVLRVGSAQASFISMLLWQSPRIVKLCLLPYALCVLTLAYITISQAGTDTGYDLAAREHARVSFIPETPTALAAEIEPAEAAGQEWDGTGAVLTPDFRKLLADNRDTVAWLHIPGADTSYPVMQAADNDYYNHTTFEGEEDAHGSIFMECTNAAAFTDRNTFIYGHNMADRSMFGALQEAYERNGALVTEPYFYVYLPDGAVNRYRIFSCYQTTTGSDTYVTFEKDEAYDCYAAYVSDLDRAGCTVSVTGRPPIVTLSTCAGSAGTTKRYVVHGFLDGVLSR